MIFKVLTPYNGVFGPLLTGGKVLLHFYGGLITFTWTDRLNSFDKIWLSIAAWMKNKFLIACIQYCNKIEKQQNSFCTSNEANTQKKKYNIY